MELILVKTANGLKPAFDDDYEKYSKLKNGDSYKTKITKQRNIQFHRMYFALINCAWEYQNEKRQEFFKNNIELFRKSIEVSAGHCDLSYSIDRKEWLEIPKSISFDKMDEFEFKELYERVKDVLFGLFLTHISEEEFVRNLVNF